MFVGSFSRIMKRVFWASRANATPVISSLYLSDKVAKTKEAGLKICLLMCLPRSSDNEESKVHTGRPPPAHKTRHLQARPLSLGPGSICYIALADRPCLQLKRRDLLRVDIHVPVREALLLLFAETSDRRCGAHMGFSKRIDTILN